MYSLIPKKDCTTAFPGASPTSALSWINDVCPRTVDEAEKRAEAMANAVAAQYEAGTAHRVEAWRGEILAAAKANPENPGIPLAYAGEVDKILDMHLQYRNIKAIGALCDELDLVSQQYSGDEKIAAWYLDSLWRFMRCLSRIEGLEAIGLCPFFKERAQQFPASRALAECYGRALLLSIKLQSKAVDDEGNVAPSSGSLISLDAAVDEYAELAALSGTFKSMELIRMQAGAAAWLCMASEGKPSEAVHWLGETQKLYERFPGCEETVFAHLAGLGAKITSLKKPGDIQEAERCLRKAEYVLDSVHRDNARLRNELFADMLDLMHFYGRIGLPGETEHVVSKIFDGTKGLEAEEQLRFTLNALGQQVAVHVDALDLPAAGQCFGLMCDYFGKELRDWPGASILVNAGQTLLDAHCRAAEFPEAEKVLNAINAAATVDRQTVQEAVGMINNMRQAYEDSGLPPLPNTGFIGWIGSTLSRLIGTAGKWRAELSRDREKAVATMVMSFRLVECLLALGMDIKAFAAYMFTCELCGLLPDDSELACVRLDAGILLMRHYAEEPSPRKAELLARELLDVAGRFPDVPDFLVTRTAVLVLLHRTHLMAYECEFSEEVLERLSHLHWQHRDDQTVATRFAAALNGQLLYHIGFGQTSKFWAHFATLAAVYDEHPGEGVGQYLVDAGCVMGGFFLSRRMGNELAKLADLAGEQCRRHLGDLRLEALWSNLENKRAMLTAIAV